MVAVGVLLLPVVTMTTTWFLLPRVQQRSTVALVTVLFAGASFVVGNILAFILFAPPAGIGLEAVLRDEDERFALLRYPTRQGLPYATVFTVFATLLFLLSRGRRHSRPSRLTVLFACGAFGVSCILAFVALAAVAPPGASGLHFLVHRTPPFAVVLTVFATFLFSLRRR